MKAAEILTELSDIDLRLEMYFRRKGYIVLGRGQDQMAFSRPNSEDILKIFGTRGPTMSNDQKLFFEWVNFCRTHSSKFLPKFKGVRSFDFNNQRYIMMHQEKYYKLPRKIDMWLRLMRNFIDRTKNVESGLELLKTERPNVYNELFSFINIAEVDELYNLIITLDALKPGDADINYMMTSDRHLIITEAWAYTSSYDFDEWDRKNHQPGSHA
jgi:hypothetical protein